ncbi:MAG: hypothetical protein LBB22_04110 [Treponema sp.]|nr:hypothetical protein [Treponema sp.]
MGKTQFAHIAETLGCELISAGSPQSKGRIERLWETLQSRLPVWFKLNGITTMEQANAALPRFITAFAPIPADFDLDTLLTARPAFKQREQICLVTAFFSCIVNPMLASDSCCFRIVCLNLG